MLIEKPPYPNTIGTSLLEYQFERLHAISRDVLADEFWRSLLDSALRSLESFDPGIVDSFGDLTPTNTNLHQITRYCIPLFEFHYSKNKRRNDDHVILAATYLWVLVWRPLDDLLDEPGPARKHLPALLQAFSRAERYQLSQGQNLCVDYDICACALDNIHVEQDPQDRARFSNIYRRARIFETATWLRPDFHNTLPTYRQYINTIGHMHDLIDFLHDHRSSSVTPVTTLWEQFSSDHAFRLNNVAALFSTIKTQVDASINHLFSKQHSSAMVAKANVNLHYDWLF